MAGTAVERERDTAVGAPRSVGVALLITGLFGLLAAFELTLEKIALLRDPNYVPQCDFSVLVSCNVNLRSWQGELFGFPNPLIGLIAWSVIITTAVIIVAGTALPRWYWLGLLAGLTLGLAFVVFLVYTSIFELGTLCPWCMATWAALIPTFWIVLLHNARMGNLGGSGRFQASADRVFAWIPMLTVLSYLLIIVIAQLRIDAVTRIIYDLF